MCGSTGLRFRGCTSPATGRVKIRTWLDANPCSAYVVLDDDVADMAHMRCRQVKTSIHEGGLQDYHVKQVCDLLGVR